MNQMRRPGADTLKPGCGLAFGTGCDAWIGPDNPGRRCGHQQQADRRTQPARYHRRSTGRRRKHGATPDQQKQHDTRDQGGEHLDAPQPEPAWRSKLHCVAEHKSQHRQVHHGQQHGRQPRHRKAFTGRRWRAQQPPAHTAQGRRAGPEQQRTGQQQPQRQRDASMRRMLVEHPLSMVVT